MPAPDQLTIETPEQIALEFPLAGVGSRFLAVAFDSLLQALAIAVLVIVGLFMRGFLIRLGESLGLWAVGILLLIGFVVYSGYFAVFEAIWSGQTPGKRLVGLRVIDVTGRPVSVYAAILRNIIRVVDQLPGFYAFGILSVLVTSRNQRLGDLAAGTVVVHERIERLAPAPVADSTVRLGARRLTAAEIVLVEGFLRRRDELDPWVRRQNASQIAKRMADRLELGPIEDEERLLEQLAAEYRSSGSYR